MQRNSHSARNIAVTGTQKHLRSQCSKFDRDGSTLLIVMVLLGLLSLIGFLFYSFAAAERSNAAYYADGHKVYTSDLDPETLFNWSLQQLIVGPGSNLTHSALAGRRHSMLPNMFGLDIHPYNSAGVILGSNAGQPFVDADQDGVADSTGLAQQPLNFVDGAQANGGTNIRSLTGWPDPGVDYTYPDINNLFLAYKGVAIDTAGNTVQVIIPSFHRPQLLRTAGGVPTDFWFNDASLAGRVMRPHPNHLNPNGSTRFPTATGGTTLTSTFPFEPGTASPNGGHQGVWSWHSFNDPNHPVTPTLDVDNDGDTIKEGVWLDLHFPVQTDSTGRRFVPLFSFTVYDADALFNLNVHGNRSRLDLASMTQIGNIPALTKFLSSSNQGLTPSEVNPQYPMNSDPNLGPDFPSPLTAADLNNALKQHTYQFGGPPTNYGQLSNMEWYRILTGTANFQSATGFTDVYPGRYGEQGTTLIAAFNQGLSNGSAAQTPTGMMPAPGVTNLATSPNITSGSDDNWNIYEGGVWANANPTTPGQFPVLPWEPASQTPGYQYTSPYVAYTPASPMYFPAPISFFASVPNGQPLDFNGDGTIVKPSTNGKTRLTIPLNRMPFSQYVGYDNPGATTSTVSNATGTYQAGSSDTTNLFSAGAGWHPDSLLGQRMLDVNGNPLFTATNQAAPRNAQLDEDSETIVEPTKVSLTDSIYSYDEMAGLHLSPTDKTNTGVASRLEKLAPFNFSSSARAGQISQRFTPASWDRRQYGYAGTGNHRTWEFTGGTTFPPTFGFAANAPANPFRQPVRVLLEMTVGNMNPSNEYQFRLSLNHLTTTDSSGNLIQRSLTAHDPNLSNSPVVNGSLTQEDYARRDRQQMARDIYVMLYTLGGGLDFDTQNALDAAPVGAQGYTGDNSGFRLYNGRQLREMAQFAVNIVDAQDPDRVMTKFEYDKNLGDGWNLNDNAYDNDGFTPYATTDMTNYNASYPEDSDGRGVVYGVEAQELTLSEAMVIRSNKAMMNHLATQYDDAAGHRYFTYVELRNISANTVDMIGQYRVRVMPEYTPTAGSPVPGQERRVTLLTGSINPDSLKTIGSAGQSDVAVPVSPNHSRFQCAIGYDSGTPDFTQPYAQIVPPATTALDYDLLNDTERASGKFRITKADGTDITSGAGEIPGGFLNETTLGDDSSMSPALGISLFSAKFTLERRQYPDRPAPTLGNAPEETDNPWVPVDLFDLEDNFRELTLAMGDTAPQINPRLQAMFSRERLEPMDRTRANAADGNGTVTGKDAMPYTNCRPNSISRENSTSPTPSFKYWQLTYDRPFASPVELLHIPLHGPNNVTRWTSETSRSPLVQTTDMQTAFSTASMPAAQNAIPTAVTGAGKILQAEFIENQTGTNSPKEPALDNRWYRMFEFFEVPTRMHRQLGSPLSLIRQPGKMNLNLLRFSDNFAGLLDDTDVLTFAGMQTVRPTLYGNDPTDTDVNMPANRRDWWVQFLKSRDGRLVPTGPLAVNKVPDNVTGLFLPGLADSSPFRGLGTLGFVQSATRQSPNDALESTMFRKLPFDLNSAAADPRHLWEVGTNADHAGTSGTTVESEMRHRLLSKIFNNTTNRSHVFMVYVSVQPFQADDSAGSQNVRIGGPLNDTNGNPAFNYRGFFVIDRSQPEDAYIFDTATNTGSFSNYQALVKYRLRLN